MTQSLFISLDGIDGSGKSTQCRLLGQWLRQQGHSVRTCADPGSTSVGDEVRKILLYHEGAIAPRSEALLFMACRAQLVEEVIRPALRDGTIVISDRFLLANVVYQGWAGGLPREELWKLGEWTIEEVSPDLTLVLDLPLPVAVKRRKASSDRIESRDRAHHEKVKEGFLKEAERSPDTVKVIDANHPTEQVQAAIQKEVIRVLEERAGT